MFRLIHIIIMSLNKFRFVAQVATLGNFFISIIKIISIIGLIFIMIQDKMLLLNLWLQKKWPIANLCLGQIKTNHF